jgi:hypothetical protein
MLALLLLLGFAPPEDQGVRSGPPSPVLEQRAASQWRLSSQPAWRAFRERWGGDWAARWDERTGAPRFLWAPGVPLVDASALVDDLALLVGIDPSELVLASHHRRGEREVLRYERRWKGAPVQGDQVALVATNGRIGGVWLRISPVSIDQTPLPGERVLALPLSRGPGPASTGISATLGTVQAEGPHVVWRGRDGLELHRHDSRSWATVTLEHEERTVGDAVVQSPAREVTVLDASGASSVTADDGSHGLSGELTVSLEGPELLVLDKGASIAVTGSDELVLAGGEDLPWSATQVQHVFHQTWDWLEDRWPTHPWLGQQVPATVELDYSACNAFYTSGTINFFVGYSGYCNNSGRIADVIIHEMGHGVHHYILEAGTFASDISEGSADYIAATILDDPNMGPEFYIGAPYLRELDSDHVYPDDYIGEEHHDGLIWGSFMWNLRQRWSDAYGEEAGVRMSDLLLLGALEQGPTLTDAYEAVILADDDNGDLSDATPHACELMDLMDQHGLGPGPIGVVVYDHRPLEEQGSSAETYPVDFDLYAIAEECGDLDIDSVQLWYALDPVGLPGEDPDVAASDTGDTGLDDPYEGWVSLELSHADGHWTGEIPRQAATSRVHYFIQASSGDGSQTVYSHGGAWQGLYSFLVGDREILWCEGFEHGAAGWEHGAGTPWEAATGEWVDEWTYGTPTGGAFMPDGAYEGSMVATTGLDVHYGNDNLQYLRSPTITVHDPGPMLLLSMRRWLTVEDGIYDRARLFANDELLWENRSSEGGSDHTLDTGWTLVEYELEPLLDADRQVGFTWTLRSDPGLEFGGWALDDVCVVQLADPPGHYRVRDLVASDDLEDNIVVTWTQPWIEPLSETVLVRSLEAWPTGPEDGVVVYRDTDPVPGQVMEVVDDEIVPDHPYHYALFAAQEGGSFLLELVEGENADQGIAPTSPPEDSAAPQDTDPGDPPVDTGPPCEDPAACDDCQEPASCGCTNAGAGVAWGWLVLIPALVARRRR